MQQLQLRRASGAGAAAPPPRSAPQRRVSAAAARGSGGRPASPEQPPPVVWARVMPLLAAAGAVGGTLLDGIHSAAGLQVYDAAPLALPGGAPSSLAVPPLLAVFYVVLGSLALAADRLPSSSSPAAAPRPPPSAAAVAAAFGMLALNLQLSAALYAAGVPYPSIAAALAAAGAANFAAFDRTPSGAALALLCAVGAPLGEEALLSLAPLWHYARPDLTALPVPFVSWVPFCYAFYVPAVCLLARWAAAAAADARDAAAGSGGGRDG
jgi:heat shock protein 5